MSFFFYSFIFCIHFFYDRLLLIILYLKCSPFTEKMSTNTGTPPPSLCCTCLRDCSAVSAPQPAQWSMDLKSALFSVQQFQDRPDRCHGEEGMIVGISNSRPLVWLQGADSFAGPEGKYSRDLGVSKGISPPSSLFIYLFFFL